MFRLALNVETYDGREMADEKLIISTTSSREEAAKIAKALVEERLVACVNIVGPMESVYRWQDKIESSQEFLLLLKTTSAKSQAAITQLRQLHSYELPEAIEINIDGGSPEYLKWIAESV